MVGFPRLYAAASLKRSSTHSPCPLFCGFSAALCRGLIEAQCTEPDSGVGFMFSAALCRGLIEASGKVFERAAGLAGFPRLYAAASLKRMSKTRAGLVDHRFSAALCRGLIEARPAMSGWPCRPAFSAALCRGLIEALEAVRAHEPLAHRFPRLYAAASLKLKSPAPGRVVSPWFSAALCRGLIEARQHGSLWRTLVFVFRGFMPRPH